MVILGLLESPGGMRALRARWHQALSLWLWSLHHGESKPQLPHSNKLHTIPQKHRNAGNQQLEPYDISFFPLFLVFALPLALGKGILQQLGLDQAAVALLWHCCGTAVTGQAGTHQASQPCLGWACQRLLAPPWFSFALWPLQDPPARLEGKPGPSPTGLAPGKEKVAPCGVPFLGEGAPCPSPCLSSTRGLATKAYL